MFVWLKATAQVGTIALVHCRDELAIHRTASILVIYGKLHHGDIIVFLNKYAGVQFSFAEHIHDAQYLLNTLLSGHAEMHDCYPMRC
jgi:translation initiation factor IF-2